MKIDKARPKHWAILALSGLIVVIAMLARSMVRRANRRHVVLYGHKLGGNLLALYRHLHASGDSRYEVVFLTMDPDYNRELRASGVHSRLAISPASIALLATTHAIVSDHGLHVLEWMLGRTDVRFFDVWHGIPFKGFDAEDFRPQHRYDEVWVASPLMCEMYVERFGFDRMRVQVTGYARTDRLVTRGGDADEIRKRLGLDGARKWVLFAPTWKQDAQNRNLFPFGVEEREFLARLADVCDRHGAGVIMRRHLNSTGPSTSRHPRIIDLPYAEFPDTEEILLVSDVLICDWSSIAFDFLLLDRPAIFLEVAAPFAKGFSLDAGYRYGDIATDMEAMLRALDCALAGPEAIVAAQSGKRDAVRDAVYGGYADGQASARCMERLRHHLARDGSSR